jgi:hypothetical protein
MEFLCGLTVGVQESPQPTIFWGFWLLQYLTMTAGKGNQEILATQLYHGLRRKEFCRLQSMGILKLPVTVMTRKARFFDR